MATDGSIVIRVGAAASTSVETIFGGIELTNADGIRQLGTAFAKNLLAEAENGLAEIVAVGAEEE